MEFGFILLTIIGLSLFEIITSIDNAVINAEVLSGMSQKARRWFLVYGFFFAVIAVRGLLPLFLVSSTNSAHILLIGGGVFLVFLFFNWLFLETKEYGLRGERFFQRQGAWFFAIVSILLSITVWFALKKDPIMAFSAVLGSSAFFIVHGFKNYAKEKEKKLLSGGMSDLSKILYLEVLDASFSIDGIVGAFAFTLSIPLILLGNGLGALILRKLTISNIERIKKYKYLKNGAMYSILFLGIIMILDSFGFNIPEWLSPIITFGIIGYFFNRSRLSLKGVL